MKRIALATFCALLYGCAGSSVAPNAQPPSPLVSRNAVTTKYIQLVIFENQPYQNIIGDPEAPYITGLAKSWANMTQSFAIAHPSQSNYLALFSGSTQGVTNDDCPVSFSVANLGSELLAKKMTFT